jgi:hypothetical protein
MIALQPGEVWIEGRDPPDRRGTILQANQKVSSGQRSAEETLSRPVRGSSLFEPLRWLVNASGIVRRYDRAHAFPWGFRGRCAILALGDLGAVLLQIRPSDTLHGWMLLLNIVRRCRFAPGGCGVC